MTPWAGLLGLPLPNQALLKPDPSRRWVPSRWRLRLGLPCSTADVTRLRLAGPGRCGRRTEGIGMGAVDERIGRKGGGKAVGSDSGNGDRGCSGSASRPGPEFANL